MSSFETIQKRIQNAAAKAGKNPPLLVAVSKTKPLEKILELYEKGQRIFAENYVQELEEKKKEAVKNEITDLDFHFIGHLQTNKVKVVLPLVSTIHSVDSLRLFEEIEKRAQTLQKKISVYFQVNIDREASKSGFLPEEIPELSYVIGEKKAVWAVPSGLMCIPDPEKDPSSAFQEMQKLSQKWGSVLGTGLSMGMSEDFEIAISYGASMVRIGTALFGSRR